MEQIIAKIIETASSLITVNSVVIIGVIFGLTQFFKQFCKSELGRKYKLRPLTDWSIRGVAMILGVVLAQPLMDEPWRIKLVYGLFYGGMTPLVVFIVKDKIVKRKVRP